MSYGSILFNFYPFISKCGRMGFCINIINRERGREREILNGIFNV